MTFNSEIWRQTVTWAAGDSSAKLRLMGDRVHSEGVPFPGLGLLRCAVFGGDPAASEVTAVVSLGDGGSSLGPIDLPFCLTVETPANVSLYRGGSALSSLSASVALTPVTQEGPSYASHSFPGVLNAVYGLPQWVRAVNTSGTITYRDRGHAPISGAVIAGRRPALATEVLCSGAGMITYWY